MAIAGYRLRCSDKCLQAGSKEYEIEARLRHLEMLLLNYKSMNPVNSDVRIKLKERMIKYIIHME